MLFASASASSKGVAPLASIATRVWDAASSIAPRASVRWPSERTSTTMRATTGQLSSKLGLRRGVLVDGSVAHGALDEHRLCQRANMTRFLKPAVTLPKRRPFKLMAG